MKTLALMIAVSVLLVGCGESKPNLPEGVKPGVPTEKQSQKEKR